VLMRFWHTDICKLPHALEMALGLMMRWSSSPSPLYLSHSRGKSTTWTQNKTATYQEDGVIYTVRADEGEDLMDFVSNLDSKPRRKAPVQDTTQDEHTHVTSNNAGERDVSTEANTYERKSSHCPLKSHQSP